MEHWLFANNHPEHTTSRSIQFTSHQTQGNKGNRRSIRPYHPSAKPCLQESAASEQENDSSKVRNGGSRSRRGRTREGRVGGVEESRGRGIRQNSTFGAPAITRRVMRWSVPGPWLAADQSKNWSRGMYCFAVFGMPIDLAP